VVEILHNVTEQRLIDEIDSGAIPPHLLTEENLPILHDAAALRTVVDLHQESLHDDDAMDEEEAIEVLHSITEQRLLREIEEGGIPPNILTEENLPMLHDVAALRTVADLHQDELHDDDVADLHQENRLPGAQRRQYWVKPWRQKWLYPCIINDLLSDDTDYRGYLRMDASVFGELLERVRPLIEKQTTNFRSPVSAEERLSITLRFLATGASKNDLHYSSRLGRSTIRKIIDECIAAIIEVLKQEIKTPSTEQQWKSIIEEFYTRWNIPNCFGAVDGKHVFLKAPAHMGSHYYNYKGRHSIVLMAVADAQMRFTYVDIGCQGRVSDGGVWANCSLRRAIEENELNIPQTSLLPRTNVEAPNFMVADDAFPLSKNLLKPFPGRGLTYDKKIFNYRLSRARRIIENAFGLLVAKFRIFKCEIDASVERARSYVLACVCLHNFLIGRNAYVAPSDLDRENPSSGRVIPGEWRSAQSSAEPLSSRGGRPTAEGTRVRQLISDYVNNFDVLSYQDRMVA